MKKPLLLREANLPARYPPPGPVGQVIVKTYPPTRMAMVKSNSLDQQPAAGQNQMFRVLFNHIKQEKIAMTAPVVMEYEDAGSAYAAQPSMMAFLYADTDIGAPGADQAVNVVDLPAITVASVGVRGNYNDAHLQEGLRQIQDWLDASDGYTIAGPPRYLGYNSPFVPWFLRYGEVQVPIMTKNP